MLTDPMDHSGEYRPRAKINEIARKAARKAKEEARKFRRAADLARIAELQSLLRECRDSVTAEHNCWLNECWHTPEEIKAANEEYEALLARIDAAIGGSDVGNS